MAKQAAAPSHVQSGVRWLQLQEPPATGDHPVAMGVRLNAVEAQMDSMHREFKEMRSQLQQLCGAQGATGAAQAVEAKTANVVGDLYRPSDGARWGDAIGDDGFLDDTGLEAAHVTVGTQTEAQDDVAAQKVYNIINTARRHQRSADFPPAALARLMEELASDALDVSATVRLTSRQDAATTSTTRRALMARAGTSRRLTAASFLVARRTPWIRRWTIRRRSLADRLPQMTWVMSRRELTPTSRSPHLLQARR